jgi:hypothetical protein
VPQPKPQDVAPNPAEVAAGWEAAARRIAPMLGSYSAAVVTSSDVLAAAHAALGIGLAEAEHRRVAIGDLVGDLEPIQSLVPPEEDPHGISDSFTYGVSLNKIARPIDTTGNLFVMPSGTGSVRDPAIFRNARWQRLANGFREVGALLLLVAPADAPGLRELIDQMDGVVLVGNTPLDFAPHINIIARIPAPARPIDRSPPTRAPFPVFRIAALLLVLVALVGAGIWWRFVENAENAKPHPVYRRPPAPTPVPAATANIDTLTVPPPANPADSSRASAYAVELEQFSAPDDAQQRFAQYRANLPAGTISPVPVGSDRAIYYSVVAGAYPTRNEAEALLARLRHDHAVQDGLGTVIRAPYALLLDSAQAGHTEQIVTQYRNSPQPVYALAQDDGSLKIYAGAFERPEDAATLMSTLRAAKMSPVLVYRTGRAP